MDTEERVPTRYFCIPILEVEGLMWSHGRGIDGMLLVRSIRDDGVDGTLVSRITRDGEVDGRLVIGCVCDREVGQSGDADGRGLGNGCDGRCGDRVCLWSGGRFEWRGLRDLGLKVSVEKSQGYDDGCCSRVSLVCTGRLWLPGREYRWGRETLPTTLP